MAIDDEMLSGNPLAIMPYEAPHFNNASQCLEMIDSSIQAYHSVPQSPSPINGVTIFGMSLTQEISHQPQRIQDGLQLLYLSAMAFQLGPSSMENGELRVQRQVDLGEAQSERSVVHWGQTHLT